MNSLGIYIHKAARERKTTVREARQSLVPVHNDLATHFQSVPMINTVGTESRTETRRKEPYQRWKKGRTSTLETPGISVIEHINVPANENFDTSIPTAITMS
jgi:hypothetical protein